MKKSNVVRAIALTGAAWLFASGTAAADPVKCKQAIGKETQAFLAARNGAISKCEQSKIKGKLPSLTDCLTEEKTAPKLASAENKMRNNIAKQCQGENPASIGFPATCPDLEGLGCNTAVGSIADAAECLVCMDIAATDQTTTLVHDQLVDSSDKLLDKCQGALSKGTQTFLALKSKALQTCWDLRAEERSAQGGGCDRAGRVEVQGQHLQGVRRTG
jgi:hypothetical protein